DGRAVGRAPAGGPVEAGPGVAEVGRAAGAVAAAGHVVEVGGVGVGPAIADARLAGGDGEGGDEGRRGAGASVDGPPGASVRVVAGDAGVRIGDGGDVGLRALGAARVLLPARLGHGGAAAGAARAPRALGPAAGRARLGQAGAADREDVSARRRV